MARQPDSDEIECVALRLIGVEMSEEEKKKFIETSKPGRIMEGLTRMVKPGENVMLARKEARKLQDAGAVKISL